MKTRLLFAVVGLSTIASPGVVRAQTAADDAAVRNHVTCYPFGIDKVGRGDMQAGLAAWKECFSPNFHFSAFLGRGEPTNCPGDNCPFPKDMPAIEMRAEYAKRAFQGGGFVKTSHHLTNVAVSFPQADKALVNAYVQAWHWKADNTAVIAPGSWDAELTRSDGKWLIVKETLSVVGAVVVPPPAPAPSK